MSKEAVFTMKLEPELRADFMAAAEASQRPASQIMRELMREFVVRQRQASEYDDFLRERVELSRQQIRDEQFSATEDVEARAAERRAQWRNKVAEPGA